MNAPVSPVSRREGGPPARPHALPVLLLAATAALVFFFRLGNRGFENKDTVWYVEIAWETLRSGDWIVPRFNGVIFTEKPVLFVWLVAACARLAGGLTPFVSRLPSALAAFGCVFLTLSLGGSVLGKRGGILAGFILATNYAFAWEARVCMVDMVFTFFVTLSLLLLYLGFTHERNPGRFYLPAYAAVGLAALTKGPLGVVLPAAATLAYLAWRRPGKPLRGMRIPLGILIVAGMQAAWYVPYLVRIGPGGRRFFYEMYVVKENLLRFTSGFDKTEPFWFYVPEFLSHFLPWSVFLVLLPFLPRPAGGRPRDLRFPAAWFLAIFAFLTLSSGKHSRYALPLYPAAAVLAAGAWERLLAGGAGRAVRAVACAAAVLALGGAVGLPIFARLAAPGFFASSLALSSVLAVCAAAVLRTPPAERALPAFASIVAAFCCFWCVFVASLPAHDVRRAEHERLAREVAPAVGPARLATYGLFSRRLALGFFSGRVVDYLGDGEHGDEARLSAYLRSGEPVFCLLDSNEYAKLRGSLPPHRTAPGVYRYRKLDLVLISNLGGT